MKAYLIDGKKKEITEVEWDGLDTGIAKFLDYNVGLLDGDRVKDRKTGIAHIKQSLPMLVKEHIMKEEGCFSFLCPDCKTIHEVVGKGLIIGLQDNPHYCDAPISLEEAKASISWPEKITFKKQDQLVNLVEILGFFMTLTPSVKGINLEGTKEEEEFEPLDAKSLVQSQLEMARISTKKTLH